MEILKNVPLSTYSSWKVGGEAEFYCAPTTRGEIREATAFAERNALKLTVLSGGSNVLVSDGGVKGLVLHLRKWSGANGEIANNRLAITAKSGTPKSELLKIFLRYKLAPAVFLAGIPGDVGGGVVMNAGIGENLTPREFVEIVDWVEVLRGDQLIRLQRADLAWSYRHCSGWAPGIILNVGISWPNVPDESILSQVKSANHARLKKQPLEFPSCGSVFVNPPGHTAGRLIDQCGLRGFAIGDAQVSEKHANFIINKANAKARDIHQVIEHVKATVLQREGVTLRTEVVYVGEW